jgi:small GTP-binding protein
MQEFKVGVLGSGGVGKTSLTFRFALGYFTTQYDPTYLDYYRKETEVDDTKYMISVSDNSSIDFLALTDQCIKECQGLLFVYSIVSPSTFRDITDLRERALRVKESDKISMILVGNKCDLESERQVSIEEGQDLARSFGCPFFETSAKINLNVTEAFREVAREYIKHDLMKGEAGRPAGLPKAKKCLIM